MSDNADTLAFFLFRSEDGQFLSVVRVFNIDGDVVRTVISDIEPLFRDGQVPTRDDMIQATLMLETESAAIPALLARALGLEPAPMPIPDAMKIAHTPEQGEECSICLDGGGVDWVALSLCRHCFHTDCIGRWVFPTCPMCRAVHAE
jgi:hypothetical protein